MMSRILYPVVLIVFLSACQKKEAPKPVAPKIPVVNKDSLISASLIPVVTKYAGKMTIDVAFGGCNAEYKDTTNPYVFYVTDFQNDTFSIAMENTISFDNHDWFFYSVRIVRSDLKNFVKDDSLYININDGRCFQCDPGWNSGMTPTCGYMHFAGKLAK